MARNKRISEWAGFILGIGLILAILQLGNHLQGKRAIFPTAAETIQALQSLLSRKSTYTEIGTTLIQVVQSVAFSAFIGIALGTAEGIVPFLHSLLRPLYALLRSIPLIVLGMIMLVATRFSKTLMPVWTGCLILVPMIS